MKILTIELERLAFFGAARHQADGFVVAHADVIGTRQPAAHQQARTGGLHVRVVGRAHRHREIQIAIFQDQRPPPVPALHDVGDALLANVGDEKSAVEQNRVGLGAFIGAQERRQVLASRRDRKHTAAPAHETGCASPRPADR